MTDRRGGLLIAALVLFLEACAIANTPQQDLAYARWAKCNGPYVQLQQIDLDGRITPDERRKVRVMRMERRGS